MTTNCVIILLVHVWTLDSAVAIVHIKLLCVIYVCCLCVITNNAAPPLFFL